MNSATRRRLIAATGALTLLAGAGSAFAVQTSTITVGATVINGTRTLNVKDVSGGPVSSLALGAGHGGALLVNVTDVNYAHSGYQVTATMSNLYPFDTAYHFNQTPIPSSAVSLGFPGGLVDVAGLSTLVEPVIHLASSSLPFSALTPLNTTVTGAAKSVQTLSTITQSTLSAVANELPVKVSNGTGGAFTQPAGVTGQSGTFTPTSVDVLDGTKQSLTDLVNDLTAALNNGANTAQDFITAGVLDQNSVLAAGAQALGLTSDQLTAPVIAQILNVPASVVDLQAVGAAVDKIIGQTGSYNTVSALSLNLPDQQPAGSYQGELTFTLLESSPP